MQFLRGLSVKVRKPVWAKVKVKVKGNPSEGVKKFDYDCNVSDKS